MWKRLANWAIKLGLTGGSVAYLLMSGKVDIHAAIAAMSDFSLWFFLAAMGLQVVQVAICAIRWQMVLRAIGAHLPFLRAAELFSIGNFFGQILPGAVGGDAIRMLATRRAGIDLAAAINSVMLERAATVFALVLLTTLAEPALLDRLTDAPAVWLFPALTVGAIAGLIVQSQLDRAPESWKRFRIVRGFGLLAADTRKTFFRPKSGLPLMGIALLGHVNLAMVVWVLALGLGAPVTLVDCLVLVPPVVLVATLPISIAGWGAREVAMVTVFGLIGVPSPQATALSVLFGLATLATALPGGLFWLLERRITPLEENPD
jgi:uncharacterized membrane protein YbhN (UPF0104 family)